MNSLDQSEELSQLEDAQIENQLNARLLSNYHKIKGSFNMHQRQNVSENKSMRSVEKAIEKEEQKNLQTRMALTEKQYSKARENNILLLKKLSEAEEYAQFLKSEIQKVRQQKQEQAAANNLIIDKLNRQLEGQQMKSSSQFQSKELSIVQQTLAMRQKEISRLTLKVKSLELSFSEKDEAHRQCLIQLQNLKQQLQEAHHKSVCSYDDSLQGSQLLELENSRHTIQRLFLLLKNTEEYRSFFSYSQNCQDVIFLDRIAPLLKGSISSGNGGRSLSKCKQLKIDQRLLWSPTSCYKALLQIRAKHQFLSEPCLQQILFELNRLWLNRQELHVAKLKEQHEVQISKLKARTAPKYDQLVARKQIQRMKKELQQNRFSKSSPTEELSTLKILGQCEDQLRLKEKEVKLLTQRLQLVEGESVSYDRILYLQGALWLIDKVIEEIQLYQQQMHQSETKMKQRLSSFPDFQKLSRLFDEYFQKIDESGLTLQQRLVNMKETTLKKMASHKKSGGKEGREPFAV